jgi:hypothetical protein
MATSRVAFASQVVGYSIYRGHSGSRATVRGPGPCTVAANAGGSQRGIGRAGWHFGAPLGGYLTCVEGRMEYWRPTGGARFGVIRSKWEIPSGEVGKCQCRFSPMRCRPSELTAPQPRRTITSRGWVSGAMRVNAAFGLAGVIASLLSLGALVLGGLSIRVAYSNHGEFVDAARGVWLAFGLWNLLISFMAGWAAFHGWRALFHCTLGSRDQT